jgi:hypothetical protein
LDQHVKGARSAQHFLEERDLKNRTAAHLIADEVAGLAEHRLRDDQLVRPLGDQARAAGVVAVAAVEQADQDTCVAEQRARALCRMASIASTISRLRRSSAMISRYLAEKSCLPVFTSPAQGILCRTAS